MTSEGPFAPKPVWLCDSNVTVHALVCSDIRCGESSLLERSAFPRWCMNTKMVMLAGVFRAASLRRGKEPGMCSRGYPQQTAPKASRSPWCHLPPRPRACVRRADFALLWVSQGLLLTLCVVAVVSATSLLFLRLHNFLWKIPSELLLIWMCCFAEEMLLFAEMEILGFALLKKKKLQRKYESFGKFKLNNCIFDFLSWTVAFHPSCQVL